MIESGHEADHLRAAELLPWLTNGRLQGEDLHWLNAHLAQCPQCRREQLAERRIRDAVASEPAVEFAPLASYNRLWARIEADSLPPIVALPTPVVRPASARQRIVRQWLVAGLAAQAIAIVALAATLWQTRVVQTPANYRTVTSTAAATPVGDGILIVFDEATTVADMRALLGKVGMTLRAGPTQAGVYTLAPDARHAVPVSDALQVLRADRKVLFAERSADPARP